MPAQEQTHRVREITVRVLRAGSGAPIVFLHGAGGLPAWNSFFEELAAGYDVRVPEHPGFGTDKHAKAIRNIADLAMYYLDFLDELGGGPVHLIGHSLGGWTAAEIAVRDASRLATLTLIAPAGIRIKGIPSGDNFIWSPEESVRNRFFDQALAEQMLGRSVSEEEADRELTNRFMAARLGWEPRWFNPQLEGWLHRIRLPSLLVWGEDDKLMPAAYADAWQARIPQLRVQRFPECGHVPHVEKAEQVAAAILRFLESP